MQKQLNFVRFTLKMKVLEEIDSWTDVWDGQVHADTDAWTDAWDGQVHADTDAWTVVWDGQVHADTDAWTDVWDGQVHADTDASKFKGNEVNAKTINFLIFDLEN